MTTITSQAGSLNGFAGTKAEAMKSGDNTICDMWSKDRKSHLTLIVEPPRAASGVPMRKMLAVNATKTEPGMTVKDEPALGASAFSFVKKEQLSFSGVGKGGGVHPQFESRRRNRAGRRGPRARHCEAGNGKPLTADTPHPRESVPCTSVDMRQWR